MPPRLSIGPFLQDLATQWSRLALRRVAVAGEVAIEVAFLTLCRLMEQRNAVSRSDHPLPVHGGRRGCEVKSFQRPEVQVCPISAASHEEHRTENWRTIDTEADLAWDTYRYGRIFGTERPHTPKGFSALQSGTRS
eukprot:scaffold184_cov316-Pinguiococcus_pyrenoidosus.AAC.28